MKRVIWIALAVLVCTAVLTSFTIRASADLQLKPIKSLLPQKTFPSLATPTPKPKLTKFPYAPVKSLLPHITLTLATPTPTAAGPADDPYAQMDAGQVINLGTSTSLDVDDSGPMSISLTWDTDSYGYGTYTLTAGSQHATGDCIQLLHQLYFAKLAGFSGAVYMLIPDNGESDDPITYVYKYSGGHLVHVGDVPSLPDSYDIHDGIFTTTVRGSLLQTWFRPADFSAVPNIHEIRRDLYPMGTVVTLLQDLPLQSSRTDATISATLHAGDHAILATTDDIEWVNIIKQGASSVGGWMHVVDSYYCEVGDAQVEPTALFDGLFLAD